MTRQRRTFTSEFKLQLVKIYENGKSRADISKEYDIIPSALDRWIKNYRESGSFAAKGNCQRFNIRTCREKMALCMLICRPF